MKLLKSVAAILCAVGLSASASTSNMTATATDTDGTAWSNCIYTATITILGQTSTPPPTIGGVTVSPLVVKGSCSASGVMTPTLTDTSSVDQKNVQWVFKVQSNTSAHPVTVSVPVVGASPNLTNSFSLLEHPRFATGANAYGYADIEVQGVPQIGSTYYNVTTPCLRQFSLAGWTCGGGSTNASTLTTGSILPQLSAPIASTAVPSAEWPMDDYTGTTARDISGNDNTATLNGATWIPGAGIQCLPVIGATPQTIVTPLSSFGTIMIAFAPWNNGGNQTATPLGASTGPSNVDPTLLGTTAGSTGGIFLYSAEQGAMGMRLTVIKNPPSSGGSFIAPNGFGGLHVFTYESSTADAAYVDGVAIPGSTGGSSTANAITSGAYQFCAVGTTAVNGYRGTIMYAKAWPAGTYLTAQQVQTESNRIATIVNARPSIPKYPMSFVRTPTIVGVGDSIMHGVPGTGWLNSTNVTPTNTYTITDTGLFGVTARDLNWNSAHWLQALAPSGGKNYCLVNPGSNDIAHSDTPADILSSNLQLGFTAKANGCIPILGTTISRGGSLDANIATLDTLERANAVQSGAFVALVDFAELSVLSPNGTNNTSAACYQGDFIHLTGPGAGTCANSLTGYGNYALAATRIVNTLDGSTELQPDLITSNAFVETDANNVMIHTPTAVATNQLPDCSFITGRKKTVTNQSLFAITMTTTSSQTITGNAVIAAGGKASYTATVTSPTAGGCYWLQQ